VFGESADQAWGFHAAYCQASQVTPVSQVSQVTP
jgi:hypothetical protein